MWAIIISSMGTGVAITLYIFGLIWHKTELYTLSSLISLVSNINVAIQVWRWRND